MPRDKPDLLQHRVPIWISETMLLFDTVADLTEGADQPECRHAVGQPVDCGVGVMFLLKEEIRSDPSVTINPMSRTHAWSMRG